MKTHIKNKQKYKLMELLSQDLVKNLIKDKSGSLNFTLGVIEEMGGHDGGWTLEEQ